MDLQIEGSILDQGIFNMNSNSKPPIPGKKISNQKTFGTDQETFSEMNMRGIASSTNTSFSNIYDTENDHNSNVPMSNKENPFCYQNSINPNQSSFDSRHLPMFSNNPFAGIADCENTILPHKKTR